jgi:hypothetical protein
MFPDPTPIPRARCEDCGTLARVDRMVHGLGSKCARDAGLIVSTPRLRTDAQTGPDLLDLLDDEPEDHCDGWDR